MPLLKMSRQIPVILSVMAGIVATSAVSADWQRIGFAGKEIRALAAGHDVLHDRQVVYTPVDDSGVFMVSGQNDSMYQFPFHDSPNDRPAGKIYSLLVAENGATVLAGSDSGLYGASMYFSSLPIWRKTPLNSTEPVVGIAKSDSAFCAVTASGIYRSKIAFGTWWPCSLSGVPVRPVSGSVFTAVTSWPFGRGFAVGSAAAGGQVIFGTQDARSWTDGTCIAGCTCVDAVYSLAADSQYTIYAGTSEGVFYGSDFDTGCWHFRPPQLEMPIRDICLARMKTFAVEVIELSGDPVIFAGTVDGLWKYERSTSVAGRRSRVPPQPADGKAALYSIDGRAVPRNGGKAYRGVYIMVEKTSGHGISRVNCILR